MENNLQVATTTRKTQPTDVESNKVSTQPADAEPNEVSTQPTERNSKLKTGRKIVHHRKFKMPSLLFVLAIILISKYIQTAYPDAFQQYPAVEWMVNVCLKIADFGYSVLRVIIGTIAELLSPLSTLFKQAPNWQNISNEWINIYQQFLEMMNMFRF